VVSLLSLDGKVTAPVKDAAPETTAINTAQYTGTVAWQTSAGAAFSGSAFVASTVYKALVTLSAKTGYTFDGVTANSGTLTITFPVTDPVIEEENALVSLGASTDGKLSVYSFVKPAEAANNATQLANITNNLKSAYDSLENGAGTTITVHIVIGGDAIVKNLTTGVITIPLVVAAGMDTAAMQQMFRTHSGLTDPIIDMDRTYTSTDSRMTIAYKDSTAAANPDIAAQLSEYMTSKDASLMYDIGTRKMTISYMKSFGTAAPIKVVEAYDALARHKSES
jgi:hypothetical protein